jgi:hypothetical protein
LDKQIAITNLNEVKQNYLNAKVDDFAKKMNFGKYIGMALAYYQCGIFTAEEHSKLLDEI